MTDQFVGQITLYAFGYAPQGWAICAGQLLPITQNTALYSLLGTNFGGDGVRTFGLPDLRGVAIYGTGSGPNDPIVGQQAGSETVTLDATQLPSHTHAFNATTQTANQTGVAGNLLATTGVEERGGTYRGARRYSTKTTSVQMAPQNLTPTGGGGPHNNMQPYLAMNYCIALIGIYPQRS